MQRRTLFPLAFVWAASLAGPAHVGFGNEEWPQFRGPTGQGLAPSANPPVHWDKTANIAWQQTVPGGGWSSPILHRARIFLTTAITSEDGKPKSLRVLCYDVASGELLWNEETFAPTGDAAKHRKNSYASATPVAENGRVYAHFGPMGTACLDMNGRILWKQNTLNYPPLHGNGGSPVVVGDKLIFSCDGASDPFVAALDKATGKLAWKSERHTGAAKKFSFSTPLLIRETGRESVVSPGSGGVMAYDPLTGKELWRVNYGQGYSVVPRPVYGDGLLYVSSGFDRAEVYAIRAGGAGDVTESHVVWRMTRSAPKTPSMILLDQELYFVSDNGIASCVDAKTGEIHWQERVGGDVSASPVCAAGRLYVTTEQGKTVVLRASKQFEVLAENDLAETTYASCALLGRSLLMRTESHLYRIEERSR